MQYNIGDKVIIKRDLNRNTMFANKYGDIGHWGGKVMTIKLKYFVGGTTYYNMVEDFGEGLSGKGWNWHEVMFEGLAVTDYKITNEELYNVLK